MPTDRYEYMKAYYAANKERLAAQRKAPQKMEALRKRQREAEARYQEKKRVLAEIAAMTFGVEA